MNEPTLPATLARELHATISPLANSAEVGNATEALQRYVRRMRDVVRVVLIPPPPGKTDVPSGTMAELVECVRGAEEELQLRRAGMREAVVTKIGGTMEALRITLQLQGAEFPVAQTNGNGKPHDTDAPPPATIEPHRNGQAPAADHPAEEPAHADATGNAEGDGETPADAPSQMDETAPIHDASMNGVPDPADTDDEDVAEPAARPERAVHRPRAAPRRRQPERPHQPLSQQEVRTARSHGLEVGGDPGVEQAWRSLLVFAESPMTMLIRGASGTGKEPFARAVHGLRKEAKLTSHNSIVTVNCAGLNSGIIESELFGHKKGAFTGATADRKGWFEVADGGTLFLDEIGDMPLDQQAKLLRAVENGIITPAGSNEEIRVNVKVVCATHQNLEELVRQGRFRQDLYYRLKATQIRLPSWDARHDRHKERLINWLLARVGAKNKAAIPAITADAVRDMMDTPFHGNVRDVRDTLERAFFITRHGKPADAPVTLSADAIAQAMDAADTNPSSSLRAFGSVLGHVPEKVGDRVTIPVSYSLPGDVLKMKEDAGIYVVGQYFKLLGMSMSQAAKRIGMSRRSLTSYLGRYYELTGEPLSPQLRRELEREMKQGDEDA